MFDALVVNPLINLLIAIYGVVGDNLGIAIILLTVILRVLLLPLTVKQIQVQKKIQELQPKLQSIQLNKKDPSKFTPQEMELLKESAYSCLGAVIPLAIQIPVLIGLNIVINRIASVKSDPTKGGDFFNNVVYFDFLKHMRDYQFNTYFLGLDLSAIPQHIPHNLEFAPYLALIFFLTLSQFVYSKITMRAPDVSKDQFKKKKNKPNQKKLTREEKENAELREALNKWNEIQVLYLIPLMVGLGAYSFPAALGIYWLAQNLLAIIQTVLQYRHAEGKLTFASISADVKNFFVKYFKLKTI